MNRNVDHPYTNHLIHESSLYLQQHAHNPVNWFAWDEGALEKARSQDKPIFLSIGYSSCHWCHVMETEVFEKEDIAELLNRHFISIKVDREERPDLDAVYMEAVMAMTGSGGWPMSVFLTPDLKPFFGGTYFPYEHFKGLIERIHKVFTEKRSDLDEQGEVLFQRIAKKPIDKTEASLNPAILETAVGLVKRAFDPSNGGMQSRNKFPIPLTWHFLLHYFRKTGDESVAKMVKKTLDEMAQGGIYDHVAGGFHRYTVDQTWTVPHFEKMLYDNALIASLFCESYAVFSDPLYRRAATGTLDFMIREMMDEQGGFYASFDADSGGEEGSYYVWTTQDLQTLGDEKEAAIVADLLGISTHGNFEGKNVLTRRTSIKDIAKKHSRSIEDVTSIYNSWLSLMKTTREKRVAPGLDKKIVTSWNGLAITAMVTGYKVFEDSRYLEAAKRTAEFLWSNHREGDSLIRATNNGTPSGEAVLTDYAALADGLLELFQVTSNIEYLDRAIWLLDKVVEGFADDSGGFYTTSNASHVPLGRQIDLYDNVRPSGNSLLLHAFHKASDLMGDDTFRKRMEAALPSHGKSLQAAGVEMTWWLDAILFLWGPAYTVVIAGDPSVVSTGELRKTVLQKSYPYVRLISVPQDGVDKKSSLLSAHGKTALEAKPTAYVCEHGSCKRPVFDTDSLTQQILVGWNS